MKRTAIIGGIIILLISFIYLLNYSSRSTIGEYYICMSCGMYKKIFIHKINGSVIYKTSSFQETFMSDKSYKCDHNFDLIQKHGSVRQGFASGKVQGQVNIGPQLAHLLVRNRDFVNLLYSNESPMQTWSNIYMCLKGNQFFETTFEEWLFGGMTNWPWANFHCKSNLESRKLEPSFSP